MEDEIQIEINSELLNLIAEIDEFRGTWKTLHHLAPERLLALRKVATIESIGSSTRIEGAKLSDKEVEKLLSRIKKHAFRSRDEEEVAGYAEVMEQVFLNYETIPITENYLKQLHSVLLKYSSKDTRHRGEYKKLNNHVEAFDKKGKSLGVVFETATPFQTPFKMQALFNWIQKSVSEKTLHPLLIIGVFIVWFLAIHPFQDGNGRLSRILTTLLLLKWGYHYVPYSSLENIIEENKEMYYLALRHTQNTFKQKKTNWLPWLKFFLQSLKKQKDQLEKKLQRETLLIKHLNALSLQILDLTKGHGRMTIGQLEKLTRANRNTLKAQLRQLVAEKYLVICGKGRATWYVIS